MVLKYSNDRQWCDCIRNIEGNELVRVLLHIDKNRDNNGCLYKRIFNLTKAIIREEVPDASRLGFFEGITAINLGVF